MSIKVYKFEDYSVEVIHDPAHRIPKSVQDELIWECTELSRNSFGNPDIKEEFVRFCVLNSSIAVFGWDCANRLVGYSSHSIKRIEGYYIIYLQSVAISKEFQGKRIFRVLISVELNERKNRIKIDDINSDHILLTCRTQNPLAFKFATQNLGLFPKPDGIIEPSIRHIGKKIAERFYDKPHIEHGKQIVFDDQTFVERCAYKSVTQTGVNGIFPSGIPFCYEHDDVNQYMNRNLNWQNGDALILVGYYDEEKVNQMFAEVQHSMGFCGIEQVELGLHHAMPL